MTQAALREALDHLGRPRLLIIGDLILDRYVSGEVSRISPEAPIPVLLATRREERLGGAGNVAANLCSLDAEVALIGVVGDDASGRDLLGLMQRMGVDVDGCVRDATRPTTVKTRMISGVQQMIRIDWEEARALAPEVEERVLAAVAEQVPRAAGVLLSDYGKGVLTDRVLRAAIDAARAAGVPVLVDPKGQDFRRYRGATLLTPNRKEAEGALRRKIRSLEELPEAARELMQVAELEVSVITLGADGICFLEKNGRFVRVPTVARAVFDVTGAGDTVIALLAVCLADKQGIDQAVGLANQAAGLVVAKRGAASVTRTELRAALGQSGGSGGKRLGRDTLVERLTTWRQAGDRIVFTNGCFDVLHAGHVQYLRFARSKGDRLVVGVNDDASVRRLKGEKRPVNPLDDRLEVLAALEMVDGVIEFAEDTPLDLIQRVTPDVLVKGQDWEHKGVVGREWVESHGGQVVLAPLLAGRSTTAILERGGR
jgi:D-beta-D-heptose 7-phosphate kinase/D-beta-D-heptose 1-phosphate adenosyltransferase